MKKILPLILVGLFASMLIFYKFPNLPKYLAFDEVEFSRLALSLKNKPYIPYSPLATGHSTLYFYIILFSFNIFGVTNFALRFPAAIFGVLSVLIFYQTVKGFFQKQFLPLLLTLIFLSSRWFLNFARFSFEATFLLFLELISIYFFLKYKDQSKAQNGKNTVSSFFLLISGLFAGLAFLSYTPGRIFFILPVVILLFKKQFNRETMKQLLLFLIPFIIITTPLNLYFLNNKDSRIDQQFFLRNSEMTVQQKVSGLWHNISSTALMFNIRGDVNGRHNYPLKPALNPILGILFIIGFIGTIRQWSNINNIIFLLYFLLSIFPALMTYPWENPNMLRTFTVIPSVVYFTGQGIIVVLNLFKKIKQLKKYELLKMGFIISLILLSAFYEVRTYFKYQPSVFEQAFEMKKPLPGAFSEPNPYEKSH